MVLIDTDVLLKLAAFELIDVAMNALPISRAEVQTLPKAEFVVMGKAKVQKYGVGTCKRAAAFARSLPQLDWSIDDDLAVELGKVDNIDEGEAILFAAAAAKHDSIIVTGDKRALRALQGESSLANLRLTLKGRILCLESLLLRIIDAVDFEEVVRKVAQVAQLDTAVNAAFGSRLKSTKDNVVYTLREYIYDLSKSCPDLGIVVP